MARQDGRQREPSGSLGGGKSKGGRADKRRVGPDFNPRGRLDIYTRKSGSEAAYVYLAQSSKGLIKVGFSMNLEAVARSRGLVD